MNQLRTTALVRMMRSYLDLDDDSPDEGDIRFEDLRNVNEWDASKSLRAKRCRPIIGDQLRIFTKQIKIDDTQSKWVSRNLNEDGSCS